MKPLQSKRGKMISTLEEVSDGARGVIDHLQAVVLLAGSVRPTRMQESIGGSILDMPVDESHTILEKWHYQAEQMTEVLGIEHIPLSVRIDQSMVMPLSHSAGGRVEVVIERDIVGYRGTGGVLHDLSRVYDGDDYILVASARQVMLDSLGDLVLEMVEVGGDVCLIAHQDGTPSGLMLVRCGVLDEISQVGFQDMKEQVLPVIASSHDVTVVNYSHPSGLPARRSSEYVRALRRYHLLESNGANGHDPLDEDWQAAFSIVEDGGEVSPSAQIHDSVVLAGGRVEADAVVVRSIVCPGGVVVARQTAIDSVVAGT